MKILHIDEFEGICGYSYTHRPFCNGGYNWRNPDCAKENGIGYCYGFACPIAICADEEDFEKVGMSLDDYEEDMFVIPVEDENGEKNIE